MNIKASDYPRLEAAGYEFLEGRVQAPGAGPGNNIREKAFLDQLEGRLSNIAYMAHAIDIFDTASSCVARNPAGGQQFAHLMNPKRDLVWTGFLYVALRRFEREGRLDLLRAGLGLLIAVEKGIASGRDAVQAMAHDLVQLHDIRDDDGGKAIERQNQLPGPAS